MWAIMRVMRLAVVILRALMPSLIGVFVPGFDMLLYVKILHVHIKYERQHHESRCDKVSLTYMRNVRAHHSLLPPSLCFFLLAKRFFQDLRSAKSFM